MNVNKSTLQIGATMFISFPTRGFLQIRPIIFAASLIVGAVLSNEVQGGFITGIATAQADNPTNSGTVGEVTDVVLFDIQGSNSRSFTNTIGLNADFQPVIRVVSTSFLQGYSLDPSGSFNPINYGGGSTAIIAVSALEGKVISTSGTASTAQFTSGKLALYVIDPQSGFVPTDPSTWGAVADVNTATLNEAIAMYALKPQEDVFEGVPGQSIPVGGLIQASAGVNLSTVDTGSGNQTSGNLLFKEDPANDFFTVTTPTAPPGTFIDAEGIFVQFRQSINTAKTRQVSSGDLQYLNVIAGELGGYTDLGGAGTAFATGLAGPTDIDPRLYFGDEAQGDFVANFDSEPSTQGQLMGIRPGIEVTQIVPEPSTMSLLWACAVSICAGQAVRRVRSRKSSK